MSLLGDYFNSVSAAMVAVQSGEDPQELLATLQSQQSELAELYAVQQAKIKALEAEITNSPQLHKARLTKSMKADARRNEQPFVLSWRGGGSSKVKGWSALSKYISLAENSIKTKLSLGRETFSILRDNPNTGEQDLLYVTRVALPQLDMPTRLKRGRPRKRPLTEQEYNAQLGLESGIVLAPPARTMPKTRIRRTREKR